MEFAVLLVKKSLVCYKAVCIHCVWMRIIYGILNCILQSGWTCCRLGCSYQHFLHGLVFATFSMQFSTMHWNLSYIIRCCITWWRRVGFKIHHQSCGKLTSLMVITEYILALAENMVTLCDWIDGRFALRRSSNSRCYQYQVKSWHRWLVQRLICNNDFYPARH